MYLNWFMISIHDENSYLIPFTNQCNTLVTTGCQDCHPHFPQAPVLLAEGAQLCVVAAPWRNKDGFDQQKVAIHGNTWQYYIVICSIDVYL